LLQARNLKRRKRRKVIKMAHNLSLKEGQEEAQKKEIKVDS
jgi:hypothetical protein